MAELIKACLKWRLPNGIWWTKVAFVLLIPLFGLETTSAQTAERPEVERQIKAAYLFKFGSYVEWPERAFANANSPLQIGIIGADAFADEMAQLTAGRTINGRPVTVRKLRREDSISGLNILFIGGANGARIADILAATKGQPMLTVTEFDEALSLGSMINFVIVGGKVRFEAAPKAASSGHLSISARLLAAAYKVASGSS
jgi:hypothetical protein